MNTFKILAVAVALTFGAVSVNAQKDKTFSFIDAAGNEVADGSSLDLPRKSCAVTASPAPVSFSITQTVIIWSLYPTA